MNTDLLRSIAITIPAVVQTLFVLLYVRIPWWEAPLGRALFYNAITLAVTVDTIAAARWARLKDHDWLFICLFLLVTTGVWVQLIAFYRTQRGDRANKSKVVRSA